MLVFEYDWQEYNAFSPFKVISETKQLVAPTISDVWKHGQVWQPSHDLSRVYCCAWLKNKPTAIHVLSFSQIAENTSLLNNLVCLTHHYNNALEKKD